MSKAKEKTAPEKTASGSSNIAAPQINVTVEGAMSGETDGAAGGEAQPIASELGVSTSSVNVDIKVETSSEKILGVVNSNLLTISNAVADIINTAHNNM